MLDNEAGQERPAAGPWGWEVRYKDCPPVSGLDMSPDRTDGMASQY